MLSPEQLKLIKQLRSETKISIAKCQEALQNNDYDLKKSLEHLKRYAREKVFTREGRETSQGRIFEAKAEGKIAWIELKSETDFVSNQQVFVDLGNRLAHMLLSSNANLSTAHPELKVAMMSLGENIVISRQQVFCHPILHSYLHQGKKACVVYLEQGAPEVAKQIAIHTVACNPISITAEDLEAHHLEHVTAECKEVHASKNPEILARIIQGSQDKFIRKNCLMFQKFYSDENLSVTDYLKNNNSNVSFFCVWNLQEKT